MNVRKIFLICRISLCFILLMHPRVHAKNFISSMQEARKGYLFSTAQKQNLKVDILTENILRIRVNQNKEFRETLLERYDIINSDWPETKSNIVQTENDYIIGLSRFCIHIDKSTALIRVINRETNEVINQGISLFIQPDSLLQFFKKQFNADFKEKQSTEKIIGDEHYKEHQKTIQQIDNESNMGFSIILNENERFYGFGSAVRGQIEHRGSTVRIWADYQNSESPTPFVMSTHGWALFLNTTQINYWDIDNFQKNKMLVWSPSGDIDIYLMLDAGMPQLQSHYTSITGKPYLLPRWAYGLAFGSNLMENQFDVLNNAVKFRDNKIPCDIYWIEPQWMGGYDFSTSKKWDYSKFRPFWPEFKGWEKPELLREHLFVKRLKNIGFKIALWLCVDTDLSVREEDKIAQAEGKPVSGKEHWFDHLTQFMDDGVKGFKLDPGRTLNEHPDRIYHNGKTDKEMHLVQQVLLSKQMMQTYKEHTGERSFHHYCGGYAGSQHWGAMTSGDNGGGKLALHDMLNLSMSGFVNTSSDVLERVMPMYGAIHFGFFQPWVQINSWAEIFHPWYFSPREKNMFRDYAKLRYKLIPYIYSYALNASLTGIPIVRPMPLAYPKNRKFENSLNQFMFGDYLLVGAFTDHIVLPEGIWIDYWTGKKHKGNQTVHCQIPENRGGPLFIRQGAIIPTQTDKQFLETLPSDTLIITIYPDKKKTTSFNLYEDDGISYDYRENKYSCIEIECKPDNNDFVVSVSETKGLYKGLRDQRFIIMNIFMEKPKRLIYNDQSIEKSVYQYDEKTGKLSFQFNKNIEDYDTIRCEK